MSRKAKDGASAPKKKTTAARRPLSPAQRDALEAGRAKRNGTSPAPAEPAPGGPTMPAEASEPPRPPVVSPPRSDVSMSRPDRRGRRLVGPDTVIFPALGSTAPPEPEPEEVGEPLPQVEWYTRFTVAPQGGGAPLHTGTADECWDRCERMRQADPQATLRIFDPEGVVVENELQAARDAKLARGWKVEVHKGGLAHLLFKGYPRAAVECYNHHVDRHREGTLSITRGDGSIHAQKAVPQFRHTITTPGDEVQVDTESYRRQVGADGQIRPLDSLDNPQDTSPPAPEPSAEHAPPAPAPWMDSGLVPERHAPASGHTSLADQIARIDRALLRYQAVVQTLQSERTRLAARYTQEISEGWPSILDAAASGYLILSGRER